MADEATTNDETATKDSDASDEAPTAEPKATERGSPATKSGSRRRSGAKSKPAADTSETAASNGAEAVADKPMSGRKAAQSDPVATRAITRRRGGAKPKRDAAEVESATKGETRKSASAKSNGVAVARDRVASTRPNRRRGMTRSQIRAERRGRANRRKARRRAVMLSLGGVFAVVMIFALVFQQGLFDQDAHLGGERGTYNSGGPVGEDPDDGRNHIRDGEVPSTEYSVRPPTSGPHWNTLGSSATEFDSAPTGWGPYDRVIADQVLVHNLEHGGIGMHYDPEQCGDECTEIAEELSRIARDWNGDETHTGFVIAPYPEMDTPITITAWRHHMRLNQVEEDRIREFINAYYDRAWEPVVAGMTPN